MSKDKREDLHRINYKIRCEEVRLVGDNVETGVYNISEALKIARDLDLDLVEISPKAEPPVCKIINYKKFLYDQKKKKNENKPQKVIVKEIRFTPVTGDHDFEFKKKHAISFLEQGNKLKASVFFAGRMINQKEMGEEILLKLARDLEDYGVPEALPTMEGKRMYMFIKPKKKKQSS